jgi:high-affinity Fe2+/Pb2+ permease
MAKAATEVGRGDGFTYRRLFRSRRIRQIFPPACVAAFIVGIVLAPRAGASSNAISVIGVGMAIGLVLSLLLAGGLKALDLQKSHRKSQVRKGLR